MASYRPEDIYLAASMYYSQGQTMQAVARRLGTSRSTVSRLLARARSQGIVSITLTDPSHDREGLASAVAAAYGVRAQVVPLPPETDDLERLSLVAAEAARTLTQWMGPSMVLAVAWGNTTAAIAQQLKPQAARGSVVVQLNGAANTRTSGVSYTAVLLSQFARAFGASVLDFPVPAFFDSAETKEMMWRERSITRVLEVQAKADVAVMSVGAVDGPIPSHVYAAGYLDKHDLKVLGRERVVGDVCTVFLRQDGSYDDIEINRRASGPTPVQLRAIPRRLLVVASESKVGGLLGALRAGVATDLVIDERTAARLV
ncbi:MAG: MarR family transcriptional regulator [Bifidobacteriaceae bacterium]|nr:MarR family transcriptional regulator [Bifidobacteriaceae bacterium]